MIYNGTVTNYSQIPENTTENNIMLQLKEIDVSSDINITIQGFQKLAAPDSVFDILGGLKAATMGGFETLKKVFTTPKKIFDVIIDIFHIPDFIIVGIGLIVLISITFVLINLRTQGDN